MPTSLPPFWEDLLAYIDDRRVIPIVGAELLRIPQPTGGDVPLSTLLARRLAERLDVPATDLPEDDAVHAVVCRYVGTRGAGRRQELYTRLHSALSDLKNTLPTPPALRKLAAIRHFDLFVSTTYDTLLARALDEERFGGSPKTRSIAYAPNDVQDLPGPLESFLGQPIVYHLLGRSSVAPDYAVTEEDVLEFLYALQSDDRRPKQLFKELRKRHLLLIGNRFPDWLARFFIRLAKQDRLSGQRDSMEYVADRVTHRDESLVVFLRNFSHTEIYAGGGAVEFVDELAERYAARQPPDRPAATAVAPTPADGGTPDVMPSGSVFLSYASQDRPAVQQIHDALQAVGVDVWFDRRQLEAADDYALKIRRNIKSCALFVPVVSANTQARLEGFFRREWNLADDRAEEFAKGVPFIVPICIDDTREEEAAVPERFLDMHWARLPGGKVTDEFALRMVRLVREYHKRQQRGTT